MTGLGLQRVLLVPHDAFGPAAFNWALEQGTERCPCANTLAVDPATGRFFFTFWEPGAHQASLRAMQYTEDPEPALRPLWTNDALAGGSASSPVLSADASRVYVTDNVDSLHALDTATGEQVWSFPIGYAAGGSPSLSPDGLIIPAGGRNSPLLAVRDTGSEGVLAWRHDDMINRGIATQTGAAKVYAHGRLRPARQRPRRSRQRHRPRARPRAPVRHIGIQRGNHCRPRRHRLLMLNDGRWGNRQIVSSQWVKEATGRSSTPLNAAYGYLWWLNRPGVIASPLVATSHERPGSIEPEHRPGPGRPRRTRPALLGARPRQSTRASRSRLPDRCRTARDRGKTKSTHFRSSRSQQGRHRSRCRPVRSRPNRAASVPVTAVDCGREQAQPVLGDPPGRGKHDVARWRR